MTPSCLRPALIVASSLTLTAIAGGQDVRNRVDNTRSQMTTARSMLERGDFRRAEAIYSVAIDVLEPSDGDLLASAHFGRAFAMHQRFVTGDTVGSPVKADAIVSDYARAEALNSRGLGAAAQNNTGLVLRAAGRHADAAAAFARAAEREGAKSTKATYYWNYGRELEAAGESERARAAYVNGLETDPRNDQISAALIDLLARHFPADSAIARATKWSRDTTRAKLASDGMVALLLRDQPAVTPGSAERALVILASSWPTIRLGPDYFATMLAAPLRRIASQHPSLADGVTALADAYAYREPSRPYVEPPTASWWRRESRDSTGRHAVWSSLLRSIGDAYNQQPNGATVARGYYEAALGWRRPGELRSPHVDRRAMLPLAVIYLQSAEGSSSTRLVEETRRFTEMLFDEKVRAYRDGDLAQIRDFHTTLGAIYAAQGKWASGNAQNAEFQLEGMRRATAELSRRTSTQLVDPPNLLEELAKHYQRAGRTDKVTEVSRQVRETYVRIGRPAAGDSAVQRIDRTTRVQPQPRVDRVRPTTP
jgi:tetratricopeptide (TPR) repeat protein